MTLIERILEGGDRHTVRKEGVGYSIYAKQDDPRGIELFQPMVEELRENEGEGFRINKEHETRECGNGWIDMVWIELV